MHLFANSRDAFIVRDIKGKKIDITLYGEKENVVIVFLDNPGGIERDVLPKIFDPYFYFKAGSGIGLYMSKMIIENSMNGIF